jgi:hypothetical protein
MYALSPPLQEPEDETETRPASLQGEGTPRGGGGWHAWHVLQGFNKWWAVARVPGI